MAGTDDDPLVHAVHDVSGGGLAVALAEMAVAASTGCSVDIDDAAELFTELPSRFVVATGGPDDLCARAAQLGVPAAVLGPAAGDRVHTGHPARPPRWRSARAHEGNLAVALGEP